MSIKPVMSMFATELDCLRARDKWYFTENAELSQQLEDAKKDADRYRAHIQESADRADRAIASLNLPEGSHKKELLQVLRDFHLSAIAASKPAKEECDG